MRRLIVVIVALVALALGGGINSLTERRSAMAQYPVEVRLGADAEIGGMLVHVREVRATRAIGEENFSDGWDLIPTDFVWVAVDLSTSAVHESAMFREFHLIDAAGRRYESTNRAGPGLSMGQPGIWRAGRIFFEVPQDGVGEMTLELYYEAHYQPVPMPFGRLRLTLDPADISSEPIQTRYREVLPAGER